MQRLLGGLGAVAPFAIIAFLVELGDASAHGISEPAQATSLVLTALLAGSSITAGCAWLYLRRTVTPVVVAVERVARGDPDVAVPDVPRGLEGRLARALGDIARSLASSRDAALTDRLTGVGSRQALLATLFAESERANRYERPLAVAFIDIDRFKSVNDTYGHHGGDIVLRAVAQTIRSHIRGTDTIGRYGGEEFMVILPETELDEAGALADKLRRLVEQAHVAVEGNPTLGVTVSIGVTGGHGRALHVEALVRDADVAMYTAKSLGRNQVSVFTEHDEGTRVARAPISLIGRAKADEAGRIARGAAEDALVAMVAPLPSHRGRPSSLVSTIAVGIARHLGLPKAEVDRIRIAGLLHDIGKIAVPEEILEKPGPLTAAEWQSVVEHPRIGQVILDQSSALRDAAPIILHHHERYGGHGYPHGLRGADIPLGARIVGIADAYQAMVDERPYKVALTHEEAVRELRRHTGTQFDPELVTVFCELYAGTPPDTEAETTLRRQDPALRRLLA